MSRGKTVSGKVVVRALFACALACAFALAGCASQPSGDVPPSGDVAAYFGEHVIGEDEVTSYTQEFRAQRGLEDAEAWSNYLSGRSMTAQQWREAVIRQLADEALIRDKAAEYGITADADAVDARIAVQKEEAGVAADDERAWASYLAEQGETPEGLRETIEFSSIEQQVFSHDIDFTGGVRDELCNDYIRDNLADQIVRRYSALEFPLDDEAGARSALGELMGLSGDALATRFEELAAERHVSGLAASEDGDLGWDFLYDEVAIDPDLALRKAMLGAGALYDDVLVGTDCNRVVLCTDRAEFVDIDYASIESESLKEAISSLARISNWTALTGEYLGSLEDDAGIKVSEMPEGLPYDVD